MIQDRKLGIALVGLGKYSELELAPALQETRFCRLAGIVTGSREKAERWKSKYHIEPNNVYDYSTFDSIRDNRDIDIVYVVLPNSMHAEFTIRAAQAGKHVICEKPMAITEDECLRMIEACKKAGKLLGIGYRLHFEPHNLTVASIAANHAFGAVKTIASKHGMDIEPNVWRLKKDLAGGGPLMDVGIYCVQAAIYCTGQNPVAVTAKEGRKTDMKRFAEVEQSITWEMEFPGGVVAKCESSYSEERDSLRVETEQAVLELEPAYAYRGLKAKVNGKVAFNEFRQQARQMDAFAEAVLNRMENRVPGEMGLRDVRILQAIYEAARTGQKIKLSRL
jgi:predicted dehydrogenase